MRKYALIIMLGILLVIAAACGKEESANTDEKEAASEEASADTTKTITFLDKEYEIPSNSTKIVAASQEAMEDSAVLGVKPVGAVATGGEFPAFLGDSMSEAEEIGDKFQPSTEKLLQLKPDVILGTSKFQADVADSLNKVAPMIPISHISTHWKDNLLVLAEITNKTEEPEKYIADYEANVKETKTAVTEKLGDKEVLMFRVRNGSITIYPESVYFNPVLYTDLGLTVPEEVKAAKAQEQISLEKLAEMNPDYLFVQFEDSENQENKDALKDLESNAIWKNLNAVKDGHVYENVIDPMAAGGTAWSKTNFLAAFKKELGL